MISVRVIGKPQNYDVKLNLYFVKILFNFMNINFDFSFYNAKIS